MKVQSRFKETLARVEEFRVSHGPRADAIIRFEWRCWKRLLQTREHRVWRPVRMGGPAAMQRMYRQDARAREDWTLACRREAVARPVEPDDIAGKEALRDEYLVAVMQPGCHYSLFEQRPQRQPDGSSVNQEVDTHFVDGNGARVTQAKVHANSR